MEPRVPLVLLLRGVGLLGLRPPLTLLLLRPAAATETGELEPPVGGGFGGVAPWLLLWLERLVLRGRLSDARTELRPVRLVLRPTCAKESNLKRPTQSRSRKQYKQKIGGGRSSNLTALLHSRIGTHFHRWTRHRWCWHGPACSRIQWKPAQTRHRWRWHSPQHRSGSAGGWLRSSWKGSPTP